MNDFQNLIKGILCKSCGQVIFSCHRHDFHWCQCKKVAVDGGRDYLKIIGNEDDYEIVEVLFPVRIKINEELIKYTGKGYKCKKIKDAVLPLNLDIYGSFEEYDIRKHNSQDKISLYEIMFEEIGNINDLKKFLIEKSIMYINDLSIISDKLKNYLIIDAEFIGSKLLKSKSKKFINEFIDQIISESMIKNEMTLPD